MARQDQTDMGGEEGRFQTTHWTAVFEACSADSSRHAEALGWLLSRYWRPVYCYLRRKGHGNEEAKDLVQGFFYEAILRRGLLGWASHTKGRFRTLLLHALDRYCSNVRRGQTARKRQPAGGLVNLDGETVQFLAARNPEKDPEQAFNYAWASQLLDEVLSAVEGRCRTGGKLVHWEVFRERLLEPILHGAALPSLALLCEKYRIPDEAKASNMIVTVKRQVQKEMSRRVRDVVGSDADIQMEIQDLMAILSSPRAGSPANR